MKRRLKKLLNTSLDELRVRGSQSLAAFVERRSWSDRSKLISDESLPGLLDPNRFSAAKLVVPSELLELFRTRGNPAFFAGFDDQRATLEGLRKYWPEAEERIVGDADRILSGYFNLLGFQGLYFGVPVDWHLEPVAGKRAPLVHWSRLNYLDVNVAGDKKIVWELNRHQHFPILGQAYWLTGDEGYAETCIAHVESWMDQNPPKLGINWASSLEVAFRSISWLWALYYFKNSEKLTSATFLRMTKFLYLNARHLETYLSTYFSPNTHLTGEALGLFYLGTLLPEFKESSRWSLTGLRILTEQLSRHVRPDGVYFEQSSYYHRYTTDFYIHLYLLLRANHLQLPDGLEVKLQALLDHLMYITRPDGTTPLFGDDDGGRLVKLEQRAANDFRATLSTGAALFQRADYKFVAGEIAEETLWLLGPKVIAALYGITPVEPASQSKGFEVGGYYVMRDGWTPGSNYLLFDCGPHGVDNCGHAHADALSFEMAANGRTRLVDPGTYTYTGSKEMRDWFRSSAAHNALTIDGESSSVVDGPFSWQSIARCELNSWITQKRFDFVSASHDGYCRLEDPIKHTRSILFLKNNYWVVRDQVTSKSSRLIELWFHFDSAVRSLDSRNGHVRVLTESGDPAFQLVTFGQGGQITQREGWVSDCYGEKESARVATFSVLANGPCELLTFLLPRGAGQGGVPDVQEIQARHGRAYEIILGNIHDVLMIRSPAAVPTERVETQRLVSDFDFTWARFLDERAKTPDEIVLIGGQTLELEGREILKSGRRIDYISVSSFGDQVRLETEEGIFDGHLPIADFETSLFMRNPVERIN